MYAVVLNFEVSAKAHLVVYNVDTQWQSEGIQKAKNFVIFISRICLLNLEENAF